MSVKEQLLEGKRVLLIALPGYRDGIINQMIKMGIKVDFINDKPNDGFVCKSLGRMQISAYQRVLDNYYNNMINSLEGKVYDYILVIRGEYTTINALKALRNKFADSKIILYMWDGLHKQNTKGIEKKWKYYDKVYTFDRIDYEENKGKIDFLPLYYYEEYLPKEIDSIGTYEYDLSFIGTGHADRVSVINNVMNQCMLNGKKVFKYIYMPHKMMFFLNKIINKNFHGVKLHDVNFNMLPFESLYGIYSKSRCVVDVENPGQHGLTMRSIEIIGLKRKFITTNPDIVNYDFYNENNILVIDRNNPVIDMDFFDKLYVNLPEEIYEKYSLKCWILQVLS